MNKKLVFLLLISINAFGFELIAHRGVHQTFPREGLDNETCTATRIHQTDHSYLENTLESIEKSFELGADIAELDIHPTTEKNEMPDQLVVFHDWTLSCRTNAQCGNGCVTNEQTLDNLQSLDIGYGYTFDQGKTFPFRGQYVGGMPSFEQVLELLEKFPSKKILVNVKGNTQRTGKAFLRIISQYSESVRSRIHYPESYGFQIELKKAGVQKDIIQADKECLLKYILVGWTDIFPNECRNKNIMIPIQETLERLNPRLKKIKLLSVLWGWPHDFIKKAHLHGTKVYASQVDSMVEYEDMRKLPLDGIMTNKIEIISSSKDSP